MPLFTKLLTAKTVQGFGNSVFLLYLCKLKTKGYFKPRDSCSFVPFITITKSIPINDKHHI